MHFVGFFGEFCVSLSLLIAKLKTTRGLGNFSVNAITALRWCDFHIFQAKFQWNFCDCHGCGWGRGERRVLECGFIAGRDKDEPVLIWCSSVALERICPAHCALVADKSPLRDKRMHCKKASYSCYDHWKYVNLFAHCISLSVTNERQLPNLQPHPHKLIRVAVSVPSRPQKLGTVRRVYETGAHCNAIRA